MKPYIIIIAGIPASGKTTYARHIAKQLNIPFIGKDAIKEKLYDVIKYDTSKRENSQFYGAASYSVFFHIAECLMAADVPFVFESNFTPSSADILSPLVEKFNYRALTVLFDADMAVLHKRFCERDVTDERHPGLASKSNVFNDFETFNKGTLPLRDFCVGSKITVDTTDFSMVDYKKIDMCVKGFIENKI
jgi:predicted kinase